MPVKPIIYYEANVVPTELHNNSAIVRKKVDETTYVNWANKAELTDFIDLLYVHPLSDTYLAITCQCGREYNYTAKADVPKGDVACSCGREVIVYG